MSRHNHEFLLIPGIATFRSSIYSYMTKMLHRTVTETSTTTSFAHHVGSGTDSCRSSNGSWHVCCRNDHSSYCYSFWCKSIHNCAHNARGKDLPEDDAFKTKPRGRRRKTTEQEDKNLQQEARKGYTQRRRPLMELHHNCMPQVSRRTVQRRVFKKDKVHKYPATERPALAPKHMRKRLEWAQRYQHLKAAKDWEHVVWSAKVAVAQSDGTCVVWVF